MPLKLHFISTARLFSRMTTCLCFHRWCAEVSVSPRPPPPVPFPPAPGTWCGQVCQKRRHLIARAHQGTGFASLSRPFLLRSTPGHDSIQSRNHGRQEEGDLLGATICFLLGKKNSPEIPSLLPLVSYWPAGATLSSKASL